MIIASFRDAWRAAERVMRQEARAFGVELLGLYSDDSERSNFALFRNAWGQMAVTLPWSVFWPVLHLRDARAAAFLAAAAMHRKATFDGYSAGEAYEDSLVLFLDWEAAC